MHRYELQGRYAESREIGEVKECGGSLGTWQRTKKGVSACFGGDSRDGRRRRASDTAIQQYCLSEGMAAAVKVEEVVGSVSRPEMRSKAA